MYRDGLFSNVTNAECSLGTFDVQEYVSLWFMLYLDAWISLLDDVGLSLDAFLYDVV